MLTSDILGGGMLLLGGGIFLMKSGSETVIVSAPSLGVGMAKRSRGLGLGISLSWSEVGVGMFCTCSGAGGGMLSVLRGSGWGMFCTCIGLGGGIEVSSTVGITDALPIVFCPVHEFCAVITGGGKVTVVMIPAGADTKTFWV